MIFFITMVNNWRNAQILNIARVNNAEWCTRFARVRYLIKKPLIYHKGIQRNTCFINKLLN